MGRVGRFACILTPMLCTLASLLCVLLLLVAGTGKSTLPDVYFFRIDVREIQTSSSIDLIEGTSVDDSLNPSTGLNNSDQKALGLADFYSTYLWDYCSGSVDGSDWKNEKCTGAKAGYAFNVEDILNNATSSNITLPDSVEKVQKAVNVVSKAMTACYVLGFAATSVTFIVGWFGLLSRWGSCVTTIFADIAFFFILASSIMSMALFYAMKGALNKALDDWNVEGQVGSQMTSITWLATAFAFAASFFWMLSTCCCSGRRDRVMKGGKGGKKGVQAEHTPYTYERVSSPYMGQPANETANPFGNHAGGYGQNVPMQSYSNPKQGPYEPMRHQGGYQ